VQAAIRAARRAAGPRQVRERARLARVVGAALPEACVIPPERGYRFFDAHAVPGMSALLASCAARLEQARRQAGMHARRPNPRKDFLLALLTGEDFLAHPELVAPMVDRAILDPVTRYLGAVPLLAGASLLWSPPNTSARSSQLYHVDDEETTQVKVFVNVTPVDDEAGPLSFLPADASARVRAALRHRRGRLEDDAVAAASGGMPPERLVGPAGRGVFLDTSRCLHFGSRANRRDRLVLLVQFFRFDAAADSKAHFQLPPEAVPAGADALQRLALGVA
jgi:hypothetical protein